MIIFPGYYLDGARHEITQFDTLLRSMKDRKVTFPTLKIGSADYVDAVNLVEHLGITRQTLWNWRRSAKIPLGFRYRNRVVFTTEEVREIESFAHQLAPAELSTPTNQLKLSLK